MTRLTIRGRLTLVYGGLFLLGGIVLLAVTYALVSHELPGVALSTKGNGPDSGISGPVIAGSSPGGTPPAVLGADDAATANSLVMGARTSTLHTVLTQGGIALAIVAAIAAGFGWLIAGRLLQPLHRMTSTARRIAQAPDADRGLHERIALEGPEDEIKELADTFDVMLERLDQSFESQRRFIANASHELRTPLTLNRTLLEVTLEPPEVTPEVHQLGTTLLAINARHGRLIDGLLLLARSERELVARSYVDLADIVEHVLNQAPESGITLLAQAKEAPTSGDSVLLERMVENLVENGVRHNTGAGGWVSVTTGIEPDGTVLLEVTNSGPVVPRYEVPGLFEPFHRLGADRVASPGAGLGLSIVRAVARAHGGEVRAEPRPGGGLVVQVVLPGAR
jgi:signal transduction histidine kinase